jgi:hypothetical protein
MPASVMPGSGTVDDGDPRLQATAAHSLPDGADSGAVTMAAPTEVGGGCDSIEPGTRQLTATAARVTTSQRHLGVTWPPESSAAFLHDVLACQVGVGDPRDPRTPPTGGRRKGVRSDGV